MSATQVGRIERGESRRLPADTFDRVAQAAGASLDLTLRWKGEALDRLLDEDHARLVELVVLKLKSLGWDVAVEASFSRFGERGSIDVLAFHPARRALLVTEVKSVTPDMQAMLGGLDRKGRLGPAIARDRGWDPVVTSRVLVVGDTRTNRRRIEAHAASVRAALPGRTRDVLRWLRDPRAPAVNGVWFMSDRRPTATPTVGRERVAAGRSGGTSAHAPDAARQPPRAATSRSR